MRDFNHFCHEMAIKTVSWHGHLSVSRPPTFVQYTTPPIVCWQCASFLIHPNMHVKQRKLWPSRQSNCRRLIASQLLRLRTRWIWFWQSSSARDRQTSGTCCLTARLRIAIAKRCVMYRETACQLTAVHLPRVLRRKQDFIYWGSSHGRNLQARRSPRKIFHLQDVEGLAAHIFLHGFWGMTSVPIPITCLRPRCNSAAVSVNRWFGLPFVWKRSTEMHNVKLCGLDPMPGI